MPNQQSQQPPSLMIRVPTVLVTVVRELARLHRNGRTKDVLNGLQQLISDIDNTVHTKAEVETNIKINELIQRISQLELQLQHSDATDLQQQNQTLSVRVEKLEDAYNRMDTYLKNNASASKRQSQPSRQYHHQPTRAKARSYDEQGLAKRLKVDVATLRQKSRDYVEFTLWCRKTDPSGLAWELNQADGLYYLLQ
ncbi:Hpt domain-containing protein [aff. Roholtiella sp. LEGE 12411]|uniref:Hpt domain-containing protein n=1 Tax=aff. Roholtiella sp. LEGE 12411 TaxID=1828822 RepID=UPI00188249EA|nr:Hpt domain-containing protein [aff. Roholtiella sp. LEGE 12411]MBE9035217.1 Hpt domain-containing protein [aff. Roholtiella sp. LEGE 12411]